MTTSKAVTRESVLVFNLLPMSLKVEGSPVLRDLNNTTMLNTIALAGSKIFTIQTYGVKIKQD
jgi:hypothetical protein